MEFLPHHLKRYIISQDEYQYTHIEHSTWRYILAHLTEFLSKNAHPSYMKGIKATGITLDRIPQIRDISKSLEPLGWVALPVSGFIPPAAFKELQSLGVLPIAAEMRSFEHMMYTPAPDIVHEAAGHAPMLADPEYSDYLKSYAKVSRRAIISKQDIRIYRAIRILSDLKENPNTTQEQIRIASRELEQALASVTVQSEASLLARMNWWTAEYGLIGDLKNPKIYGAGLLSSVGESRSCLGPQVKKIPLTIDCINYPYDITEPQPQLFVTPDFAHLKIVLEELAQTMAYRIGGLKALNKALEAQSVTSCQLNSGLEIGGIVEEFKLDNEGELAFIKWKGPCQLAYKEKQIAGQGCDHHPHGFSSPIGRLINSSIPPHEWSSEMWENFGFKMNTSVTFEFVSGLKVRGYLNDRIAFDNKTILVSLADTHVTYKGETLFHPSWGQFDMALGTQVTSVWGGAPDRANFPEIDDFDSIRVLKKTLSEKDVLRDRFYKTIHQYRIGQKKCASLDELESLKHQYEKEFGEDTLFKWEIEQISRSL